MVNKAGMAIGAAAVLLAAGGCSKKVGGQVVAVVDGQEITQGEVNAELGGQQIPQGVDRKTVMAQIVQQIVNRKLLVGRAKEQGLDKSPAYLGQVQRAQDAVLINMLAANVAKTQPVPDAAAANTFMTQNPSLFAGRKRYQLDQIAFPTSSSPALAAKLKGAKSMPEVEAALAALNIQFKRGTGTLDTANIPPAAAAQIAALPTGEPFVVPQGAQVVVSVVRSAEAVPVPAAQAQPAAIDLLRRQGVEQAMRKQVETARSTAKITYAPGFAPAAGAGAAKPS
jgi:EpsD family peptidyl-prolyl cis-trans isomerase